MNKKRSSLTFGPIFYPDLGEEQKKKSSHKFGPIFYPNLVEEKKNTKRSSLKFGPIFCPNLGEEQKKKGLHLILVPHSNLDKSLTRQLQLFRAPQPGLP